MTHNHPKPMAKTTMTIKMADLISLECPELMFTDQDCGSLSYLGLDPHQELLAFHDLDRQPEINQPCLQKVASLILPVRG